LVNNGALGNAWFVSSAVTVENADSEIAAINNFNPSAMAVVDKRFTEKMKGFQPGQNDSTDKIVLTEYKPNHLTYSSSAKSTRLAVFSEIYYDKGWNAYIDGKAADYFRADYVLRAMLVPSGDHVVEFKFEPEVVKTGEKISFAGSLLILLFAAFAAWREFSKKPVHNV
jgi:uncharacterized membrane protein YfhO